MNDTLDHADCFREVCYLGALKSVLCGHLQTKRLFVGQLNKCALTTWTQGEICMSKCFAPIPNSSSRGFLFKCLDFANRILPSNNKCDRTFNF